MNNRCYELKRDMKDFPWCEESIHNEYVDFHFHYAMEIIYMLSGRMDVYVGTEKVCIEVGDYICVNSGVPHATEPFDVLYYVCSIPKYILTPSERLLTDDYYIGRDDGYGTMSKLLGCLNEKSYNYRYEDVKEYNRDFTISVSKAIMAMIMNDTKSSPKFVKRSDTFLEIINHICDNYRDPELTTASLARRFGYTPRMLSDLFMANLKTGVKKYIDILRVNDAKFRLLSTPDSVEVIATAVGFDSVRSFYRIFSAHTGMSPGKYRSAAPEDISTVRAQTAGAGIADNTDK